MNLGEIKNSTFDELVEFVDESWEKTQARKKQFERSSSADPLHLLRFASLREAAYKMYWKENKNPGYTVESGIDMEY